MNILWLGSAQAELLSRLRADLPGCDVQASPEIPQISPTSSYEDGLAIADFRVLDVSGSFGAGVSDLARHLPVVGLCENERQALHHLRAGCYDCLVEPIDPSQLTAAVEEGLRRQAMIFRWHGLEQATVDLRQKNRALQTQIDELLRVGEIAQSINRNLMLSEALSEILRSICRVLDLSRAALTLINDSTRSEEVKVVAGDLRNANSNWSLESTVPLWDSMTLERRPVELEAPFVEPGYGELFRSWCVKTPLLSQSGAVGSIMIERDGKRLTHHETRILDLFSACAALALENGHLQYDAIRTERELRQAKDRLSEAERLAVIGQMTVSIRHEINNPLCNITLLSQTVQEELRETHPEAVELLDKVLGNVTRIQSVTQRLSELNRVPTTEYLPNQLMVDLG